MDITVTEKMGKTFSKLLQEVAKMNYFLAEEYDSEPTQLSDRLTTLSTFLARTGQIVADMEYVYNMKMGILAEETNEKYPTLAPMKFKELIRHKVANEIRGLTMAQELSRTIRHQLDAVRSQLSYEKTIHEGG
jgi:hypothetical protein